MLVGFFKKPKSQISLDQSPKNPNLNYLNSLNQMDTVQSTEGSKNSFSQMVLQRNKNSLENSTKYRNSITPKFMKDKDKTLNKFLSQNKSLGQSNHIIDMGDQVLYLGIIGTSTFI